MMPDEQGRAVKMVAERTPADAIKSHLPSLLLFITSIITAALYFTGNAYQDTLARGVGLPGVPSSVSFYETIALGASLSIGWLFAFLVILTIISIFGIKAQAVSSIANQLKAVRASHEEFRQRMIAAKASDVANGQTSFSELLKLRLRMILLDFRISVLSQRVELAVHSRKVTARFISLCTGALLGLFIGGGNWLAGYDLESIRLEIDGACNSCRTFSVSGKLIRGIAVIQDPERIYVSTRGGLILVKRTDLQKISRSTEKKRSLRNVISHIL